MRTFVRAQDKMCGHWPKRTYFDVGGTSPINVGRENFINWLNEELTSGNQEVADYLDTMATSIIEGGVMAVVLEYDRENDKANAVWLVEFITNIIDGSQE